MTILFWVLAIIGVFVGAVEFVITLATAQSAPQQAAGAALAITYAVLPYCLARAVEGIAENGLEEQWTQTKLLASMANALSPEKDAADEAETETTKQ